MPDLFPVVDNRLLTGLSTDYSLQLTPKAPQWWMSDTIVPIALVSSSVVLSALLSRTPELLATAGPVTGPAVNSVLADTGALAAGNYHFRIYVDRIDAGATNTQFAIEHRDAANAVNVWAQRISTGSDDIGSFSFFEVSLTLADLERIRVITTFANAGAAGVYTSTIWRSALT